MDIHQPSRMTHIISPIPSSANGVSPLDTTTVPKTKEELLDLMAQRDVLEVELKTLGAILDANKVTMNTTLTTFDGYPRDDIDVPLIRITRSKIIHLKNDYKALMTRIEKGLHEFHASLTQEDLQALQPTTITPDVPPTTESSSSATTTETSSSQPTEYLLPFAEVDQITPNSPASQCGLLLGDKIKRFGHLTSVNHERLVKVAELVGASENREIKVLVGRTSFALDGLVEMEENKEVTLVPRKGWGGRGTLGCHLKLL